MSPKYNCGGNHWLNKEDDLYIDPEVLADLRAWAAAIDPKDVAEILKDMVDLER